MYVDVLAKGLISQQGIYKHYVLGLLASLEDCSEAQSNCTYYEKLQATLCEVELNYYSCRDYIQALPATDISYLVGGQGQGQLGSENVDSSNYLDILEVYNAATEQCFSDLSEESYESHRHLSLCTILSANKYEGFRKRTKYHCSNLLGVF
jgi:hypothetical protein